MNKDTAESIRDSALERARENAAVTSRRLRELADEVDRDAKDGKFDQVVHKVAWGFANLNVSSIVVATMEWRHYAGVVRGMEEADHEAAVR